jgi:photosystem II stability/assembly factor-like uncharacterized protein
MNNLLKFRKSLLLSTVILLSTLLTAQNFQYVVSNNPNVHFLRCVYFPNPVIGYAVGDSGTIVKTIDSGNTWISQTSNTNYILYSVRFLNTNTGWAVGDKGTIRKTTNGGTTWINQNFGSNNYRSVFFVNVDTGFIGGSNDTLLKTTNSGNNWTVLPVNSIFYKSSVYFKNVDTGFVGGILDTLLITTNCGNTWTKTGTINNGAINIFNFPNPNLGYVLSIDYTYETTDGGMSWAQQNNNLVYNGSESLESMYFVSTNTGYIVGSLWLEPIMTFLGSEILKTTDGGNTWNSINNIASNDYLMSVFFTNPMTGYIVGGNVNHSYGSILKMALNSSGIFNNYIANKNEILIYPNPALNELYIEIPQNIIIKKMICEITNAEGKVVLLENLSNNKTNLNISQLNIGFYIIKLRSDSGIIIKKLIKQY